MKGFFTRCKQRKQMDLEQLLHSEWNRRLGVCSLAAIVCTTTLALTFYIILPKLFASYGTNPPMAPPFLAFSLALIITFLATNQLAFVAAQLPKNALLYNFVYTSHSQLMGFIIGWSQLIDWLATITILLHSVTDHTNLLFKNALKTLSWRGFDIFVTKKPSSRFSSLSRAISLLVGTTTTTSSPANNETSPLIFNNFEMDWLSLFVITICALFLCCSLRVSITIIVVFLIVAMFTTTSTTVVALLHNVGNLRVNYMDLPQSFDQIYSGANFLLLAFLGIECLAFLAEESKEPRHLMPTAFRTAFKWQSLIGFVAILLFFPFVYRMNFDSETILPMAFNSIGIKSARYLMNIGAFCAVFGALLCAFLPATRQLNALAVDGLLPFSTEMAHLSGKSGSPRMAVFVVAISTVGILMLVPKSMLLFLIPLNLCLRLLFLAVLVFISQFTSLLSSGSKICETLKGYGAVCGPTTPNQTIAPKYNRMKQKRDSIKKEGLGNTSSEEEIEEYSEISSSNENPSYDDDALIEKMWRLAGNHNSCCENASLLEKFVTGAIAQHNYNSIAQPIKSSKIHNCFNSPCGSNINIARMSAVNSKSDTGSRHAAFHIYDSTSFYALAPQKPSNKNGVELTDADSAEQKSRHLLACFLVVSGLTAISHKVLRDTHYFVPLMAVLSALISIGLAIGIAIQIFRIRIDDSVIVDENNISYTFDKGLLTTRSSRWRALGCLTSIFLLIQMLFQFSIIKFVSLGLWLLIGLLIYSLNDWLRQKNTITRI